jgi:hypothetical protein
MNESLEREILGQLILKPALLESSETLNASLFSVGDERGAFAGIAEQWEELRPRSIDIQLLARKTGLSETWLLSMTDRNFRPEPATFRARVAELEKTKAELPVLACRLGPYLSSL